MNISISEIIVILLIALLVIKPEQLPDVAFSLGRFAQYIRRTFMKVKSEMNEIIDIDPNIKEVKERKRD